ncbi:MAG: rhodanese-like domain-containing protein [Planctomycetes bacterium]|nr:rhodanese-like domain-containing protein [Planctomycetota bacterium]
MLRSRRAPVRLQSIRTITLTCVAALWGLAGCEKDTRDSDIVQVKLAEVSELSAETASNPLAVLFIDPRPQTEFEEGHIPGARNLLLTSFNGEKGRDPRISSFNEVIVYGDDPFSPVARAVNKRMLAMDYSDVRFFAGGMKEWKAANLPVETGPSKPLPPAASKHNSRGRAR